MLFSSVAAVAPVLDEEVVPSVALASVEELALSDEGGGGGGPWGRPEPDSPDVAELLEAESVDDVGSVFSRSLAREPRRLCSCVRSASSASVDDVEDVLPPVVEDDDVVPEVEVPLLSREASRLAVSVEEVDDEDASVPEVPDGRPGGGPGGGPPAPCAAASVELSVESESSLLSGLAPVCICDSTARKPDRAEFVPVASTAEVVAEPAVAVVGVEAVVPLAEVAWLELWLCET